MHKELTRSISLSPASVLPTNSVVGLPVQANTLLLSSISPPLSFRTQ